MSNKTIKFFVEEKYAGQRLDVLLSEKIADLTRSNLKKIIELGNVRVNDLLILLP